MKSKMALVVVLMLFVLPVRAWGWRGKSPDVVIADFFEKVPRAQSAAFREAFEPWTRVISSLSRRQT